MSLSLTLAVCWTLRIIKYKHTLQHNSWTANDWDQTKFYLLCPPPPPHTHTHTHSHTHWMGGGHIYFSFVKVHHNSRIMARVYVRSTRRSNRYQKALFLLAGTSVWKISSVACGFISIKINYCDYPKSLISRINEVYVFYININFI